MQQTVFNADDFYFADAPIGDILKAARNHYQQTLYDIEVALHIRASQIEAIEEGAFDKLPGRTYALGFIRTYAEYLGLDAERLIRMFKSQSADTHKRLQHHIPMAAKEGRLPNGYLILASLLLGLGVIGYWAKISEIPEIQLQTLPSAVTVDLSALNTMPAAASKPVVILRAKTQSWVELKDAKGKSILSKIIQPNQDYKITLEQSIFLTAENAGNLQLIYKDQAFPLGEIGQVIRSFDLKRFTTEKNNSISMQTALSQQN